MLCLSDQIIMKFEDGVILLRIPVAPVIPHYTFVDLNQSIHLPSEVVQSFRFGASLQEVPTYTSTQGVRERRLPLQSQPIQRKQNACQAIKKGWDIKIATLRY